MVVCELCGKNTSKPVKINIAGSDMNACSDCKNMGKNVSSYEEKKNKTHKFYRKQKSKDELVVINNASSIVNQCMAKEKISAEQLAKTLNIKDTTLSKILSNKISMDIQTAQKIQNFFNINLFEEKQESNINYEDFMKEDENNNSQEDSLGDLLMKKLNRKNNK